ncbi:hypothetical protein Nmel_007484, partial [Mimus melanotis]
KHLLASTCVYCCGKSRSFIAPLIFDATEVMKPAPVQTKNSTERVTPD